MGFHTRHQTDRVMICFAGRTCREAGILKLNATFLARPASVVRNRGHVFNQLHVQAGGLERRDGAFPTRARPLHSNLDVPHSKLAGLLGCLLCSTLAREWSAFATSLEATGASAGPAKRVAFWVRDGHCRVVEGRVNVGDAVGDIAANTFLFV